MMRQKISIFLTVFLLLSLDSVATRLHAATIQVPDNYRTIREAVDSASAGDFILVNGGVYRENVVIKKTVVLKSVQGPAKTIISAAVKKEPTVSLIDVDGAAVAGFTLTGSDKAGLSLYRTRNSRIVGNRADNNYNGVTLEASEHNFFTENTASSNVSYGFYLLRSHGNRIEKNAANSNQDQGVFLSYSNKNSLVNNNSNMNTWNGITLWDSHGNELKDNLTLRNAFGIVTVDSDDNVLDGNTTLPNIYLILPIVLIYIGIISYLIQKNTLRYIYKV
ncbi:MAG: right-handed parallel beta-helix repeat-containing protein [Deltaproteobacteria bacterium]|nr:right-handed parallel beta-helix repeat-containing protein [Deltaproteobacteria bacterium]